MSVDQVTSNTTKDMEKTLTHLQKEFRLTRTGRAAPALVENVKVNAYGTEIPLKQTATISVPEARQLLLKPFDLGLLKEIEKAILASDLGVTPQNDGKVIRLSFPALSEENRKKLAQSVKAKGEEAKVSIRNARRDGIKELEGLQNKKVISEDELKKLKEKVQDLLKTYEKKLDDEVAKKSQEIMSI
ncbi:MAG: ribosome recycling factor [Planctomycetota bacterium]|jgi:ribosome recycling factor|nr:ribosome recycling factor [Planctomycetota bacterium]